MASRWRRFTRAWILSSTSSSVPARHAAWTARRVARFKPPLFLLCLYPLARWFWLGFSGGLGANPPEFLIRSSGVWGLVALLLTLAVTPLRRMLRQPALVGLRRMLGLFAFFYTCLHLAAWALWERGLSPAAMWDDVIERTFVTVGMLAFVPMLALAFTSTRGWMRRLGRGWQMLHCSIYIIAALSVWHFWLVRAGKNDFLEPYAYMAVLAALLLFRLGYRVLRQHATP
ncbi:sulfoxide reductase heme-binding subunit YedZ [Allopusillimonas soli]|uniref:Protein-methionine-sulfoxide reductase heme-binding subunit MsrQ n=1 Tax=Allopusillimonas soli TaxID=659016 RepID=A0A853FBZ1_9BURK|nr:protein-methionine-sulfoxide reductase heme-binding subunit MsrQ [Allopusillimonas soli]NYT38314.1 sulfoxide reductase heme-binding subunit YedZ [Allopusillimonas soli]TEA72115.1 sulfoxide reductase heme-binding subunit YedZ [Allopusillimonas soli]